MVVGLFVAVANGCGGDDKSTPTPSSSAGAGKAGMQSGAGQAGGGASGSGGASGGSSGAGGSAGSMAAGGSAEAGAGGEEGCQRLAPGESGLHGLTQVYQVENQGTAVSAAGIDGDQVYFQASSELFAFPVAGGTAQSLGAFYSDEELVRGGKIYAVSQLSAEPARKLFSAPLTDLATLTTLADGIESPHMLRADDTALYYVTGDVPSIFQVPITGGTPVELVPGGDPIDMISHGGHLYWLDSETDQLERVPIGGGPREPLVAVNYGGPMVATDTAIYWIGITAGTIEKWEMGATESLVLSETIEVFGSYQSLAVSGSTVFWVFGYPCGQVHQVQDDGTAEALFSQGTTSPEWVGATDTALFVLGESGLYRAER